MDFLITIWNQAYLLFEQLHPNRNNVYVVD